MEALGGAVLSLFKGAATAAGAAAGGAAYLTPAGGLASFAPAAAAGGAAAGGLSLASILQGGATVLGVVSTFAAGQREDDLAQAAAIDAQRESAMETLQGISRRSSIRAAMAEAVGAQDVAYAASGTDLTFGTASRARKDAYREADLALTTASGTEQIRGIRLMERAKNYRSAGRRARGAAVLEGLAMGADGFASIARRG